MEIKHEDQTRGLSLQSTELGVARSNSAASFYGDLLTSHFAVSLTLKRLAGFMHYVTFCVIVQQEKVKAKRASVFNL